MELGDWFGLVWLVCYGFYCLGLKNYCSITSKLFTGIIEGSECKRNYEGCSCSEGYPGERATSICKKSCSFGSLYSGLLHLLLAVFKCHS